MRVQTLRSRLTHMENQYHATLDRISDSALIPAHRTFTESDGADGPVTMSCLPFGGGGGGRPKQLPAPAASRALPASPSPSFPDSGPSSPSVSSSAGGLTEGAGMADVAVNGGVGEQREMAVLPVSTAVSVG